MSDFPASFFCFTVTRIRVSGKGNGTFGSTSGKRFRIPNSENESCPPDFSVSNGTGSAHHARTRQPSVFFGRQRFTLAPEEHCLSGSSDADQTSSGSRLSPFAIPLVPWKHEHTTDRRNSRSNRRTGGQATATANSLCALAHFLRFRSK